MTLSKATETALKRLCNGSDGKTGALLYERVVGALNLIQAHNLPTKGVQAGLAALVVKGKATPEEKAAVESLVAELQKGK